MQKGLARVLELLDPAPWPHPDIPSWQMLWMLLSLCLQFMGDYWLRYARPDWTEAFAIDVNRGVEEALEVAIGTRRSAWSRYALEMVALPVPHNDLGLRGSTDRRHAQYVGVVT